MENILQLFIEDLKVSKKVSLNMNVFLIQIYITLFETLQLTAPNALDYVYSDWLEREDWLKKDENEKGMWFGAFHKSIRQADYFSGYNVLIKTPSKLTSKEISRLNKLQNQIINSSKYLDELGPDEFTIGYAQFKVDNRKVISELNELKKRHNSSETESIDGQLDGILWNLIHLDNGSFIYKAMDDFFEEVKEGLIKHPVK